MTYLIKTLIIVSILISICFGQENAGSTIQSKYEYSLEISERVLNQTDRITCKYLINKNVIELEEDSVRFLDPEKAYYIKYINHSENYIWNDFTIEKTELDSLFILIRDLISFSDPIGLRNSKVDFYEGRYALVELNVDNYYTRYTISINLDVESINREKYYRVKEYLNKIKTAYNNG